MVYWHISSIKFSHRFTSLIEVLKEKLEKNIEPRKMKNLFLNDKNPSPLEVKRRLRAKVGHTMISPPKYHEKHLPLSHLDFLNTEHQKPLRRNTGLLTRLQQRRQTLMNINLDPEYRKFIDKIQLGRQQPGLSKDVNDFLIDEVTTHIKQPDLVKGISNLFQKLSRKVQRREKRSYSQIVLPRVEIDGERKTSEEFSELSGFKPRAKEEFDKYNNEEKPIDDIPLIDRLLTDENVLRIAPLHEDMIKNALNQIKAFSHDNRTAQHDNQLQSRDINLLTVEIPPRQPTQMPLQPHQYESKSSMLPRADPPTNPSVIIHPQILEAVTEGMRDNFHILLQQAPSLQRGMLSKDSISMSNSESSQHLHSREYKLYRGELDQQLFVLLLKNYFINHRRAGGIGRELNDGVKKVPSDLAAVGEWAGHKVENAEDGSMLAGQGESRQCPSEIGRGDDEENEHRICRQRERNHKKRETVKKLKEEMKNSKLGLEERAEFPQDEDFLATNADCSVESDLYPEEILNPEGQLWKNSYGEANIEDSIKWAEVILNLIKAKLSAVTIQLDNLKTRCLEDLKLIHFSLIYFRKFGLAVE